MSFDIAKKDGDFWNKYYENKDERSYFGDKEITPEEFYDVMLGKEKYEKSTLPTD